jgi:hypothetical protein
LTNRHWAHSGTYRLCFGDDPALRTIQNRSALGTKVVDAVADLFNELNSKAYIRAA